LEVPIDYGVNGVNIDHDLSDALQKILGIASNTERELEFIIDSKWLPSIVTSSPIITVIKKLKLHNISIRAVIEITKSNANYCKKLMKYTEVRHSDRLQGCSVKNEKEYFFDYLDMEGANNSSLQQKINFLDRPVQFFHFKNEFFINQQKLLFENLWDNSVPAREKIIEMEKEVIDLILNPKDVVNIDELSKQILFRIIESSVDEILILIPSVKLFWNIYDNGLVKLISKTMLRDVTVKILVHLKEHKTTTITTNIKHTIHQILKETAQDLNINTHFFSKVIPQTHISLIVDNVVLIEISNTDSNTNSEEESLAKKTFLTSFSTNDAKISSTTSIFDILWVQSDFEKLKKIKQTYFDIFKGFDMKSEIYSRDWNFEKVANNKAK
jgi:hypothetical protein